MKIKVIGRSGESDSPIFFAESVESWDEMSESEQAVISRSKKRRVKENNAKARKRRHERAEKN